MTDRPPLLDERISRRRVITLGGAAVLASLGVSGAAAEWARRTAAERRALAPAPAAESAGASPTRTPAPEDDEPWPPPRIGLSTTEPTRFRFTADPGIADGEAALMREAADFARDFYFGVFGVYLTNRPHIHLNAGAARGSEPVGDADGQSIRIYLGHVAWPRMTRVDKIEVMCHEIFHLLQATLSRGAFPLTFYLVEGTAEYAGQQAVIQGGLRTRAEFLALQTRIVRSLPQPVLGQVGRNTGGSNYAISALAIDVLVGDRAMKSLSDYFANLREQLAPSEAFERAFGESVTAFEARFERWRLQNGLPPR